MTISTLTTYKMSCMPKTFLHWFSLSIGAVVNGVFTLCILIVCAVILVFQIVLIADCTSCQSCKPFILQNCYVYSITGLIYILILIAGNLWFFHGIKTEKTQVVLSWIVASSMWLMLVIAILIVFICVCIAETSFLSKGIFALIFGLIVIAILVYGLLVLVAYWLEMKKTKPRLSTSV